MEIAEEAGSATGAALALLMLGEAELLAGRLDEAAQPRQIDDAIAHHAAIIERVCGRHQPVANVEGVQTAFPGPLDLRHQLEVPPHVIDVERDTERDRFMTAEEAVEYGLVDLVLATPEKK